MTAFCKICFQHVNRELLIWHVLQELGVFIANYGVSAVYQLLLSECHVHLGADIIFNILNVL